MTLAVLAVAAGCLLGSGVAALFFRHQAARVATVGALVGCTIGAAASLCALLGGESRSVTIPWAAPVGSLSLGVDPLSSFFLLCVFTVSALSAAYGAGTHVAGTGARGPGAAAFALNTLTAAMTGVVVARDAVLFLFSWELMSIASFLLVRLEEDREGVERASFLYLAASHFGTAFLFLLFTLLAAHGGRFEFASFGDPPAAPALAGTCFVLALVGFGTKAGFWPLHFWLPEAHPAAPSHVSAVMSGVMIELGAYGLLRTLTFLGPPPAWWGELLVAVGATSAVLGVLGALGSRDMKRALAYSSIENGGIIALGIGIGVVGLAVGRPAMAALGFAGALLHVWNHGLFKTALFLGAGEVLHATGSGDLESLGGLSKRMPRTGLPLLAASVAAAGLPPLNGFAGEWLIYLAGFQAAALRGAGAATGIAAVAVLALVGGLAAAAFARLFGVAFLGEPRSAAASQAHDASGLTLAPLWIGAALCLAGGVAPAAFFALAAPAARMLTPHLREVPDAHGLAVIGAFGGLVLAAAGVLAWMRSRLLRERDVRRAVTWDCGYALPSTRMQYTAGSFAEPALEPFRTLLRTRLTTLRPQGYFPSAATHDEQVDEAGATTIVDLGHAAAVGLAKVTALQLGRVQAYLLYILITLIAVLSWWLPR